MTEELFLSSAWMTLTIERNSRNNIASGSPRRESKRRRQKLRQLKMRQKRQRRNPKKEKIGHQLKREVQSLQLKKRTLWKIIMQRLLLSPTKRLNMKNSLPKFNSRDLLKSKLILRRKFNLHLSHTS